MTYHFLDTNNHFKANLPPAIYRYGAINRGQYSTKNSILCGVGTTATVRFEMVPGQILTSDVYYTNPFTIADNCCLVSCYSFVYNYYLTNLFYLSVWNNPNQIADNTIDSRWISGSQLNGATRVADNSLSPAAANNCMDIQLGLVVPLFASADQCFDFEVKQGYVNNNSSIKFQIGPPQSLLDVGINPKLLRVGGSSDNVLKFSEESLNASCNASAGGAIGEMSCLLSVSRLTDSSALTVPPEFIGGVILNTDLSTNIEYLDMERSSLYFKKKLGSVYNDDGANGQSLYVIFNLYTLPAPAGTIIRPYFYLKDCLNQDIKADAESVPSITGTFEAGSNYICPVITAQ